MSQLFNNKYRIPSARLQNWNYANEAMYFVTICTKNRENYFGEIVVETSGMASLQPTEIGKIAHAGWYKSVELRPDMNLELGEFVVMPNHIHGIIIIGANKYNMQRRDAMHGVSTNTNAMHGVSTNTDAMHGVSTDTDAMHGVSTNTDAMHGVSTNATHGVSTNTDAMHGVSTNTDAMHGVSTNATHGVSTNTDAMHGVSTNTDAMHGASTDAMHGVSTNTDAMHGASTDAMHGVSTNTDDTEYKNQFAPQSKNLSSIIRGYKSAVTTFARKNGIDFEWQTRFHDHIIRSMDDYHRISNYIINNPTKWQEDKFNKL